MKKLLLLLFLGTSLLTFGQNYTVNVSEMSQMVDKINRTGLGVTLNLSKKDVKDLWKKKLKDYGKVDSKGDDFTIEQATIPSISSKTVRVIAKIVNSGSGVTVWWAIDLGDKWVTQNGTGYAAAERILKEFGIEAYKEDIQEQIEDAEKAWGHSVKDLDKTVKDGENLSSDLEHNKEEKIKLENELKENGEEKVQLEKDIEQNKKDQETMKQEVEKKKQAVEAVKAKLQLVK